MNKKIAFILLIIVAVIGVCGAGLSVAMLIRALQWSEWGRVLLYFLTTAVCVEMALLSVGKLKDLQNT